MDYAKDQQEMSLTLKYLLENPALLQPPDSNNNGKLIELKIMLYMLLVIKFAAIDLLSVLDKFFGFTTVVGKYCSIACHHFTANNHIYSSLMMVRSNKLSKEVQVNCKNSEILHNFFFDNCVKSDNETVFC